MATGYTPTEKKVNNNTPFEQRGRLLGSLYFNQDDAPFVIPNYESYIKLGEKQEDDYIKTNTEKNSLEAKLKAIPKNDKNMELYNSVMAKANQVLSGITPDNYADKTLEIQQLSHDLENKYGLTELINDSVLLEQEKSKLSKAYAEQKIKDPNEVAWLSRQIEENQYTPAKLDETGKPISGNVTSKAIVPDFDIAKDADDNLFKDWKEGVEYTTNKDGSLNILKDIPGQLGVQKNTIVSPNELLQNGILYYKNNIAAQAYLDRRANYILKDVPKTAETLDKVLSKENKKILFGTESPTLEDIQNKIDTDEINPETIIKESWKLDEIQNNLVPVVNKFAYTKEDISFIKDEVLLESIKQTNNNTNNDTNSNINENSAAIGIIPIKTEQVYTPETYKILESNEKVLSEQRTAKLAQIAGLRTQLNSLSEEEKDGVMANIKIYNDEVQQLDAQIGKSIQVRKQLNSQVNNLAKSANFGIKETYNQQKGYSLEKIKKFNINLVSEYSKYRTNTTINFTAIPHKIKDNKVIVGNKEYPLYKDDIHVPYSDKLNGFFYKKDGQVLFYNENKEVLSNILPEVSKYIFTDLGEFNTNVIKFSEPKVLEDAYRLPTSDEFENEVSNIYINDEVPTITSLASDYKRKTANGNIMFNKSIYSGVERIINKHGNAEALKDKLTATETLETIIVEGEKGSGGSKALTEYQNFKSILNTNANTTPEQFVIDGNKDILSYLKEEYGLERHDIKNIDTNVGIQSSTKGEIQYSLKIEPTEAAIKKLDENKKSLPTFITTNPSINKNYENAVIQDMMLSVLKGAINSNNVSASHIIKKAGALAFNTFQEGKDFNGKQWYLLPPGESDSLDILGGLSNSSNGGDRLTITAVRRDSSGNNIRNIDYKISRSDGKIQAQKNGEIGWYTKEEIDKDNQLDTYLYETPEDIKAVVGVTLAEHYYSLNKKTTPTITQTGNYKVTADKAVINNYNDYVTSLVKLKKGTHLISNGNKKIESYVPEKDLVPIPTNLVNVKNGSINKIHKNISSSVNDLLNDYQGITLTDGFRAPKGLGNDNSAHKYGHAIDLGISTEAEKLFNDVLANPSLRKQYRIANIWKHGEDANNHIHIEFLTNNM